MGGRLRPAPRRPTARAAVALPRRPAPGRCRPRARPDVRHRAVRPERSAAPAVQHRVPVGCRPVAAARAACAARAGPARVLADGDRGGRAHERLDDRGPERDHPWVGPGGAGCCGPPGRAAAHAARPGRPTRPPAAVRRRARRRPGRRDAGRVARHGERRRRGPRDGAGLRLHLVGHVVARRRRARRARPVGRGTTRELHERGRCRRPRPVPEERVRTVVAVGERPHLGAWWRPRRPGGPARLRRGRHRPGPRLRPRGRVVHGTRRHAGADRRVVCGTRAERPRVAGGVRPEHPRVARDGVRRDPAHHRRRDRQDHPGRAHRGRRLAEPAALPADRGPHRPAGRGRTGRGHRTRQRAGAGARRWTRRPRRASLEALRSIVARSVEPVRYTPSASSRADPDRSPVRSHA